MVIKPFESLLLGDFLLDTYTMGRVKRISPEAPVPILEVSRTESRPGGAGNVALNLRALGGSVTCLGRIGQDEAGQDLKGLLKAEGVKVDWLCEEKGHITPVKTRLIADSQQLFRIDRETIIPIHPELEKECIALLHREIPKMQIISISDYAKGFLTNNILRTAIDLGKKWKIPVIVDPKGVDFTKYRGATILKPNLAEAYMAAKLSFSAPLAEVAKILCHETDVDLLLITRSEAGMSLFTKDGEQKDFPVVSKEVKDVTGAGDTVLSILALSLANKLDIASAVELANIGAGISIERLGCIQVSIHDLLERAKLFPISTIVETWVPHMSAKSPAIQ